MKDIGWICKKLFLNWVWNRYTESENINHLKGTSATRCSNYYFLRTYLYNLPWTGEILRCVFQTFYRPTPPWRKLDWLVIWCLSSLLSLYYQLELLCQARDTENTRDKTGSLDRLIQASVFHTSFWLHEETPRIKGGILPIFLFTKTRALFHKNECDAHRF